MNVETALVTGSNSFIGKHLVHELISRGIKVQEYTRQNANDGSEIYPCDIVYNLASAGSKKGAYTREDIFNTNVVQTFNLLEWSRDNANMFVQFSTSSIYGHQSRLMDTGMKREPNFLYSASKVASDVLVREWSIYTGKPAIIAIPFSIYGNDMQETKLIPTIIRNLRNGNSIPIVDGDHDYLHVEDLVRGVSSISLDRNDLPQYIELNFGSGYSYSNQQVVEIIADIMHVRHDIQVIKELEGHGHFNLDSKFWRANISLTQQYGWRPKVPFVQGLRRMING